MLAEQRGITGMSWSVLVVDNASSDDTAALVAEHSGDLSPSYVYEPKLGLTHARLRGVSETSGEWVAFVDDDNLVDPGWVAAIVHAILTFPAAGGFGGRVVLDWEVEPPTAVNSFGFCFAEQDFGDEPCEVETLVGAGMVLNRKALQTSGWVDGPLLDDRIGKGLVSGGDAEMALRVRGAGYVLHYDPRAVMQHLMPAGRSTSRYLLRINRSLGQTSAVVSLLLWRGDFEDWRQSALISNKERIRVATAGLTWSLRRGKERLAALAWLALAIGHREGIAHVVRMGPARRGALLGAAVHSSPQDVQVSEPK